MSQLIEEKTRREEWITLRTLPRVRGLYRSYPDLSREVLPTLAEIAARRKDEENKEGNGGRRRPSFRRVLKETVGRRTWPPPSSWHWP
jgi:hypothetical protein